MRYVGLNASKPIEADIFNDGRNSFLAASTLHFAEANSCSACLMSGLFVRSSDGIPVITFCRFVDKNASLFLSIFVGYLPSNKLRLFSLSVICCFNVYSSARALASSASNFSTASSVSASAFF